MFMQNISKIVCVLCKLTFFVYAYCHIGVVAICYIYDDLNPRDPNNLIPFGCF